MHMAPDMTLVVNGDDALSAFLQKIPVTNMLRLVSESSVSRKKKMQERSGKVSSANAAEKS